MTTPNEHRPKTGQWREHLSEGECSDFKDLWARLEAAEQREIQWFVTTHTHPLDQAGAARFLLRLWLGTTPRRIPALQPHELASGIVLLREARARIVDPVAIAPGELWSYLDVTRGLDTGEASAADWARVYPSARRVSAPAVTGRAAMFLPHYHPAGGIIGISEIEMDAMLESRRAGKPHTPWVLLPQPVHVVTLGTVHPDDKRHPHSGKPEAAVLSGGQYVLPTSPARARPEMVVDVS